MNPLVDQVQNFKNEMEENRKFSYQCIAISEGVFYLVRLLFWFYASLCVHKTARMCVNRVGHEVKCVFYCSTSK